MFSNDIRVRPHVFGWVPQGTAEVVVELASGASDRRPVIILAGESDHVYVVELERGSIPVAVVAIHPDGAPTRFPLVLAKNR